MEVRKLVIPGDWAALRARGGLGRVLQGLGDGLPDRGEGRAFFPAGGSAPRCRFDILAVRVFDSSRVVVAGLPALGLRLNALTQDY